ncbi:MAG TPA: hypothetical protein PKN96_05050 [Flavobacterium sp.]|uniref:hypothetical protein n=1 Tax=Flavobacterium sp. TaxID=239 RepID=UPI002BD0D582|nr:hypothetical protein [Flavobacterium sp.]HNP32638.1 hypothetical protein [Flavobacterium sp.]
MKKFYFLLVTICALSSCTNDSASTVEPNPNLLKRIDFYPGTVSERHWLFNAEGLLYQVTKADGTVVQDFTYDSHNRLINANLNDYGLSESHTFTYDSNDFVTTVDGTVLHYDSSLQAYYTGDLSIAYRLTKINSEKLLLDGRSVVIDNDESGISQTEWNTILVTYSNGNISGFSPGDSCVSYSYDTNINPLRNATLPICRAFSFVMNSRWVDGKVNSANNPLTENYCIEDPESEVYHYNYNSNNLPTERTTDSYYHGVFESTMVSAKYYYQGDVLP